MSDYKLESGDVSGSEYSYLGHFRQRKYLEKGHNDLLDTGMAAAHGMGQAIQGQQPSDDNKTGFDKIDNGISNIAKIASLFGGA